MPPNNRIIPGPGQESVWDFPRPPRVEPTPKRIRIVHNGITLVDSTHALRVLETSHPPGYYIPQADIQMAYLKPVPSYQTFCEFKGSASYWTVDVNGSVSPKAAWMYARPSKGYEAIANHLAFYVSRVDECYVDDERVLPQEGDFYGGWVTADIVGPFKGGAGTWGW